MIRVEKPLTRSSRQRLAQVREALPRGVRRQPGRQAPRAGIGRWRIESAYFRDLRGESTAQIADRLDLTDHLGVATESQAGDQSRSARRYVEKGRKTLAALGAWPWALDQDGELEREWWRAERYAAALFAWHREAFALAINDTLGAADRVARRETYRISGERVKIADELYRERLRRLLEEADAA